MVSLLVTTLLRPAQKLYMITSINGATTLCTSRLTVGYAVLTSSPHPPPGLDTLITQTALDIPGTSPEPSHPTVFVGRTTGILVYCVNIAFMGFATALENLLANGIDKQHLLSNNNSQ